VPASVIQRLPVPLDRPAAVMKSIARLARALARTPGERDAARLQAACARLYALTRDEFAHVLSTFPLVDAAARAAALDAFDTSGI
jgi:hypothetical protein